MSIINLRIGGLGLTTIKTHEKGKIVTVAQLGKQTKKYKIGDIVWTNGKKNIYKVQEVS